MLLLLLCGTLHVCALRSIAVAATATAATAVAAPATWQQPLQLQHLAIFTTTVVNVSSSRVLMYCVYVRMYVYLLLFSCVFK